MTFFRICRFATAAAVSLLLVSSALALEPAVTAPPTTPLDSGNHAWMLVSSLLVLMMTGPGLALFYSGRVRKKNVLSVMMQCLFLMGMMTVLWGLYGYSLAFGGAPKDLVAGTTDQYQ